MRWILSVLVVLASAVALALLLMFNPGNLAIFWPPYRVDLSINPALLLLIGLVALMYLSSRALCK